MKTPLILLFSGFLAFGQDYSVCFYGPGNPDGLPEFWPKTVQPGATNLPAGFVAMTQAALDDCIATNKPAYTAWQSNRVYVAQAKISANLARIVELFQQIPTGRASMTNTMNATISNVSQASTHIKTMANVLDKILEELQRLGPVLKDIYRPESDSTP